MTVGFQFLVLIYIGLRCADSANDRFDEERLIGFCAHFMISVMSFIYAFILLAELS